eukprot:m.166911 g.166911  ORF g.166911 m.166911 type:complete len:148 (+) comp17760_c0_seq4:413-856(+)
MAATFDSLFHDAPTDRADVVLRSNDLPRQLRQCQEMVQEQERNFENSRNVAAVVCDCRRDATWQVSGGNNFKLRHLSEMVSWLCKLEMLGMPEFRALNQFLQGALLLWWQWQWWPFLNSRALTCLMLRVCTVSYGLRLLPHTQRPRD